MNAMLARAVLSAPALAVLLALGACGDRIENTEMPQAANQPSVEINRQGMEGAKDEKAAVGVENKDTATMGAAGRDVSDPDERVATDVKSAIAADPAFGNMKIDVHSEDGAVTLRGRAPDPAAREHATELARSIPNVRSVDNLLTLG